MPEGTSLQKVINRFPDLLGTSLTGGRQDVLFQRVSEKTRESAVAALPCSVAEDS